MRFFVVQKNPVRKDFSSVETFFRANLHDGWSSSTVSGTIFRAFFGPASSARTAGRDRRRHRKRLTDATNERNGQSAGFGVAAPRKIIKNPVERGETYGFCGDEGATQLRDVVAAFWFRFFVLSIRPRVPHVRVYTGTGAHVRCDVRNPASDR